MVQIGQNTAKSRGDLRRFTVSQNPLNNNQLTLVWKTRKEWNNNNNNNNRFIRVDERIFAEWFSKKVGSVQSVFNLKNIDLSLLVKSFSELFYFKWIIFNSQNYFQLNYFEITK